MTEVPGRPEIVSSREVFANPWMRLTEDELRRPDGTTSTYAVARVHDYALVIPFDGERFLLVEQYRYPIDRRVWEFPQGGMHGVQPDDPQRIAEAELVEETGMTAASYTHLGFLHESYGRSTTGFHVYLATDLTAGAPRLEPEEADLRSAWFTLEEIWHMVETAAITDASTVAALALLARHWGARSAR